MKNTFFSIFIYFEHNIDKCNRTYNTQRHKTNKQYWTSLHYINTDNVTDWTALDITPLY